MAPLRQLRLVRSAAEPAAMTISLTVAFATADRKHVDQHFGAARTFAVYKIGLRHARLQEVMQFAEEWRDGNENKLQAKIEKMKGCAAVYCEAIGAAAVRQLVARGIQPVRVVRGAHIADLIRILQSQLQHGVLRGKDRAGFSGP